jgi:hypothetical protein
MPSERNGRKPDSQEPAPTSSTSSRLSARAPSAWGATRDALASVHNLDALLRSSSVLYRTILDLLPELRTSSGVLLEAFERAAAGAGAIREVGAYGVDRVGERVRLFDATAIADEERDDLANRARVLADELEAAADLLALVERASDPLPTDVSVDLVVRETVRLSGSGRGRELVVRFAEAAPDCTVHADPYLLGPLLSLMVATVHSAGVPAVVVRARGADGSALFVVEQALPTDESLPTIAMRILPAVPPTTAAATHVAAQIGATLAFGTRSASLRLPCPPG